MFWGKGNRVSKKRWGTLCQGTRQDGLRPEVATYDSLLGGTFKAADFAPMAVSGGYNCRGFCWLGPARTEAVWDTGATRNSISKDYLKALLENNATSTVVKELIDIEPLDCSSVKKGVTLKANQIAGIDVTFREAEGKEVVIPPEVPGCARINGRPAGRQADT